MESISIQQLMEAVGAQRLDQGGEITFSSVSTDSRKMAPGIGRAGSASLETIS